MFLRQIMGKRAWRKSDGKWVTTKAEVVWKAAGTQSEMIYIGRRQGMVAQWVALWPIFEVCARDTVYTGGGLRRDTWWRQEAPKK